MTIASVAAVELGEIELVDHVDHEPGEMIRRKPLAHVQRQQERLLTVSADEVETHYVIFVDQPGN